MLQDIRDKSQGWLSWVIVGVIASAFVLIGTGSYFATKEKVVLAKINGIEITKSEVDQYYDRLILQLTPEQASQVDTRAIKKQALEALTQEAIIKTTSKEKGFRVSEQQVIQQINQNPSFYEEGRFSPRRYQMILAQNYFTDQEFRDMLKMRLLYQQLQLGLVHSNFSLNTDLATLFKYIDQKRDFDYIVVPKDDFIKQVKVTSEEASDYYQNNPEQFKTQERIKAQYLELTPELVKSEIQYTDKDLKEFYEENINLYTDPEKIRVAHILVNFDKNDPKAKEEALEEIKVIEQKIQLGSDFTKLAEQHSDDPVSAKKGGELYWVTKGEDALVPEFEQAAFALRLNEVSEPILSPFGYHLIKLLERKESTVEPFNEAQNKVAQHYKLKKAEDLILEKADRLVSLSYEHSDNLDKAAEETGLTIQTTDYITRSSPRQDASISLENNPAIIDAAFSIEVLEGHNSELLELEPNHYIVLRILEHEKSKPIPFEQVKDSIIKDLTNQKASQLAKEKAESIEVNIKDLETLNAAQKQAEWKNLESISRTDLNLPQELVQKAFELPNVEKPKVQVAITSVNDGDYAIVALKDVVDGSIDNVDESRVNEMKASLAANLGQMDLHLFTTHIENEAKIIKE